MAGRLMLAAVRRSSRRALQSLAGAQEELGFRDWSTADHSAVLRAPATKITTLANGLRVASESNLSAQTATVGVWIDAGSRFETMSPNGTAHFLEHMIFKGTQRRTRRELEEEVENMGGHLNAYTSREQTTYFAKVLKKHVPVAVDILSDILQNSSFEPPKIERERYTILREMEEVESLVQEVLIDRLHATAYQYSPLGHTILGPANNIKSITRNDLKDYITTHYTGPRMVVAAAGGVRHEDLVSLAEKHFCSLSTDPTTAAELVEDDPACFTGSEIRIRSEDHPFAHVALAFEGASWTDADSIPLMVMQTMLGSWSKYHRAGSLTVSELSQKVDTEDLAESFMTFNTNYRDSGLFGLYVIAKPDKLDDLSTCLMHELMQMVSKVSPDALARARNQLKSLFLLSLDGTSAVAEDIGRQLLTYGRRLPLVELFARVDAVDEVTVKRVAKRFLHDKDLVIASIAPANNLPHYNWFRRYSSLKQH